MSYSYPQTSLIGDSVPLPLPSSSGNIFFYLLITQQATLININNIHKQNSTNFFPQTLKLQAYGTFIVEIITV